MSVGSRNPLRSRALAVLGVFGSRHKATGPTPTDEELVACLEGSLSESRRQEVLSHIAADSDIYREWLIACEVHASSASSVVVPISRARRLRTVSWTITSLAAGVAAVTVSLLNLPGSSGVDWDNWPVEASSGVSRSSGMSVSPRDRIRAGFFSGTLAALTEADADRSLRNRLEAAAPSADICEAPVSDRDCSSGRDLGALSVRAFVACAQGEPLSSAALETYVTEMDVLVNAFSQNPDAPDLLEQLSSLRVALSASGTFGETECRLVNALISDAARP